MKVEKPVAPANSLKRSIPWFVVFLAAVLALLFWRSFLPDYVHFANDGPLGQQNTQWSQPNLWVKGTWADLNSLGNNGGSVAPDFLQGMRWLFGPVGFSKFYAPISIFILGVCAWIFFRALKLTPLACALGGLAMCLNSAFFAGACWGVGAQEIAVGMDLLALALIISNENENSVFIRWIRLALAGLCVGINVIEGADIGALCSMFVAAFLFMRELVRDFIPFNKNERIIILCIINSGVCLLIGLALILGPRMGLGTTKILVLISFLLVTAAVLNWALIRQPIPLSRVEKVIALGLVNLSFLLLFIYCLLHGYNFLVLAFLLLMTIALNLAVLFFDLFLNRCGIGAVHLAIVSVFAGFIAFQTVTALVSTQIEGISGTAQDAKTKAEQWDWATQWSLPKKETLGLFVPGLFGYKMDTPKDIMPMFINAYEGGVYWGGIGRSPEIDRFIDSGSQGQMPPGMMRFSGGGNYCGILVCLLAAWTIVQALRKRNSPFSDLQKRLIWFWAVVMGVSLLLAWGRFAPIFYGALYKLPYFSTIRNPAKFLIFFCWAVAVLFAYGVHILTQRQPGGVSPKNSGAVATLSNWWARADKPDRNWVRVCLGLLTVSIMSWLIFLSEKNSFVAYLQKMGFPDEALANQIAAFSISQAGWFVVLLIVALAIIFLFIAGYFSGKRARIGAIFLGAFLLFDLGRANIPYIVHWDYKQKYEIGSLNPVVGFLCNEPYEHRVAGLPFDTQQPLRGYDSLFGGNGVYRIEWTQHLFPYYNIQCLDIIQMPRMPEDLRTYLTTLSPHGSRDSLPLMARQWQLTNTRYLLGAAGFLDVMNEQLDPGKQRFHILERFDMVPKPGVSQVSQFEQLTAETNADGQLALFDFAGALPRVKLYSNWLVNTNEQDVLKTLADLKFDPAKTVLISTPEKKLPDAATNQNSGKVDFESYAPKRIVLATQARVPSVLLLNDKYDPNWKVTVDGQPAKLLRCNYIMRGVYLPSGQHKVVFDFTLPLKLLYITLCATGLGILLLAILLGITCRNEPR